MTRKNDDVIACCSMDRASNDINGDFSPNFPVSNILSNQNNRFSIATQNLSFESFESISDAIRTIFPRFENNFDPLIALMTCRKRRFLLPVFYALVRLFKTKYFCSKRRLASNLWNYVFERHNNDDGLACILLKNMETRIDLTLVEDLSEKFTFDTMVYCAMNGDILSEWDLDTETQLTYDEKVQLRLCIWLEHVKQDLLYCSTVQEVEEVVQWIVKICFPSVSTTKNRTFIWDPFDETWCLVTNLTVSLSIIMKLIWNNMKEFMLGEFIKLNYEEERELWWSHMDPEWLCVAKMMAWREYFKIHEDVYPKHQLKQDEILKQLSIEHESANVPELYFLEERKMKWIQNK